MERSVMLTSANTLASELGADVGKVTILKVSGSLGEADFKTMKEQMAMLQVLDMSGVTELPMTWLMPHQQIRPEMANKTAMTDFFPILLPRLSLM